MPGQAHKCKVLILLRISIHNSPKREKKIKQEQSTLMVTLCSEYARALNFDH
jgi:hypothetical protein